MLSCLFVFSLCCDVGNEVSQAEPEPRAEVTAVLSPFNRRKSQRDSSKSRCVCCRRRPRSRGRKQLLPLSLSTIITLIRAVQSRWYLSCASWMSRRCDKCQWDECVVWRETLSIAWHFFFFLLRLFPRSAAKTPADGECWRGGSLPRAHAVAPSRPSSKRPRTECLRDAILTQCSRRQADLKHVQMDYSSGLQWYHQFGVWGDFSGTVHCLGASEEAARCPDKSHYSKRKKECKEKGSFNCCGSNLVWNILSCLNLWKMTNFYKIRLDVTPGHNATFKSDKSGTLQCDAEKITTAKPHFSKININ